VNNRLLIFAFISAITFLLITIYGEPSRLTFLVPAVYAHCDTMDGPLVKAAEKALKTGNINHALIWVKEKDEPEIEKAFKKALEGRARKDKTSDMRFFETVVRLHRAGEGAPYEGIKPAGTKIDPWTAAVDKSLITGASCKLEEELSKEISDAIKIKFKILRAEKIHMNDSIAAGRAYVAAYDNLILLIEKLHQDISLENK
jgi:hypothetical protein